MLFRLLTLLALLIAPLAAPAAAMVPATVKAQCHDSAMHSAANRMPAGEHQGGAACCTAVPAAAIDPPLPSLGSIEPLGHLPFIEQAKPIALGAGPEAEDPPPRFV